MARRGGVEGIQVMPPIMTKKLFYGFYTLGRDFGSSGTFNSEILARLSSKNRLNFTGRLMFRLMHVLTFTDMYWNQMLKKNNAYEKRYDQPYIQ